MPTDLFKQVLFNDGEGITHTDHNNAERFLLSVIKDQVLATLIPNTGLTVAAGSHDPEYGAQANTQGANYDWATIATSRAFCISPGQAFMRPGSAGDKIQIAAGTLFQLISATLTGDEPKLLAYTFTGAEEVTVPNGHATNPRMDLVQMKLEYIDGSSESRDFEDATTRIVTSTAMNTKRRVQCTLSVKQGTAAATPAIPEPDTGYCVIGSVYVMPNFTNNAVRFLADPVAGADDAYVQDQRIPLKVKAYRVEPCQFIPVTAWTITNNTKAVATNATNELRVPCPKVLGRIMSIAVEQNNAVAIGTQTLINIGVIGVGIDGTKYDLAQVAIPGSGGEPSVDAIPTFEATPLFEESPVEPTQSTTSKIGMPVWTNGSRGPYENYKSTAASSRRHHRTVLRIVNAANTADIGGVIFYIAEGF